MGNKKTDSNERLLTGRAGRALRGHPLTVHVGKVRPREDKCSLEVTPHWQQDRDRAPSNGAERAAELPSQSSIF